MLANALASSPIAFVSLLCLGAAACTAGTLVLVQRLRLDRVFHRVQSRFQLGWGTRSFLSLLSLSLLTIAVSWLLGAIDPAAYLAPGPAAFVYSAIVLAMPIFALAMPHEPAASTPDTQLGEHAASDDDVRRAA